MDKWQFEKISRIEEGVFDRSLEKFYKLKIDGLVRENIQNSLDGKINESSNEVLVTIKTGTIMANDIPGIDEIRKHIKSLSGGNEYTKETIENIKKHINDVTVKYISFEDENTKGLTKAKYGNDYSKNGTWCTYAYKRGFHIDDIDLDTEKQRGGSHGIGKIACNAASDIHMMFFANCDEYNDKHIGGTVQFIEHQLDGECYRATGYFSDLKNNNLIPFKNNEKYNKIFEKNTRGLKVIIPYFRHQYQSVNDVDIIRSICDNFFVAIIKSKLKVIVNDKIISAATIKKDFIENCEIYSNELSNPGSLYTTFYFNTYLKKDFQEIEITDKNGVNYKFKLYLAIDANVKKGRTAIIRGLGMKIEDRTITSTSRIQYNAVLIPSNKEVDAFLKTLENESHTEISHEHIKDRNKQYNAKRFLNKLNIKLKDIILKKLRSSNPTDGKIDTSEVIYSVEGKFKEVLEKSTNIVKINKHKLVSSKNIHPVKRGKQSNLLKSRPSKSSQKNSRKKHNNISISIKPHDIKRAVISNQEFLSIDLNNSIEYDGENKCNLSIYVMYGDGSTSDEKWDITSGYDIIFNNINKSKCKIENNIISNVKIDDGKITLIMQTKDMFNSALKFMYNVELIR